jgi:hypothetical protein
MEHLPSLYRHQISPRIEQLRNQELHRSRGSNFTPREHVLPFSRGSYRAGIYIEPGMYVYIATPDIVSGFHDQLPGYLGLGHACAAGELQEEGRSDTIRYDLVPVGKNKTKQKKPPVRCSATGMSGGYCAVAVG